MGRSRVNIDDSQTRGARTATATKRRARHVRRSHGYEADGWWQALMGTSNTDVWDAVSGRELVGAWLR